MRFLLGLTLLTMSCVAENRVCASNAAQLHEFMTSRNLRFDPKLVKVHKGEHCHIAYEPSWPGFRAASVRGRVVGLIYTPESTPEAEAILDHVDGLVELHLQATLGEWVTGAARHSEGVLQSSGTGPLAQIPGLKVVRSKLSWVASELMVVEDPKEQGRRILFYGDATKKLNREELSEAELDYEMQIEFGVDEAKHISRHPQRAEHVILIRKVEDTL